MSQNPRPLNRDYDHGRSYILRQAKLAIIIPVYKGLTFACQTCATKEGSYVL